MSEHIPPVNRIPHESIVSDDVSSWTLPRMKGALITESANIKDKAGVHVRGRSRDSISGIKESIDVVPAAATPKSLTADDLKQISADAHKEGYSEGYAEGLRKGTEKGLEKGTQKGKDQAYKETKSEMIDLQNRLRDIAKNLLSPMNEQDQALENTLVEMAFFFAQSLLETEITQSPSKLYSIVNKALSTMPVGAQNISVRLNHSDAELLENILPKTGRSWNIQRDDSLKLGGCIVQSKESLVDYSIETRITKFMAELESTEDLDISTVQDAQDWRADVPIVEKRTKSEDPLSDDTKEQAVDEKLRQISSEENNDSSVEKSLSLNEEKPGKDTLSEHVKSTGKAPIEPSSDMVDDSSNEPESDR